MFDESESARESTGAVTLFENLTHRFAGQHWNTP
jgi:hypothetical protein